MPPIRLHLSGENPPERLANQSTYPYPNPHDPEAMNFFRSRAVTRSQSSPAIHSCQHGAPFVNAPENIPCPVCIIGADIKAIRRVQENIERRGGIIQTCNERIQSQVHAAVYSGLCSGWRQTKLVLMNHIDEIENLALFHSRTAFGDACLNALLMVASQQESLAKVPGVLEQGDIDEGATPTDTIPIDPAPTNPGPTNTTNADPTLTDPGPTDTAVTDAAVADSAKSDSTPTKSSQTASSSIRTDFPQSEQTPSSQAAPSQATPSQRGSTQAASTQTPRPRRRRPNLHVDFEEVVTIYPSTLLGEKEEPILAEHSPHSTRETARQMAFYRGRGGLLARRPGLWSSPEGLKKVNTSMMHVSWEDGEELQDSDGPSDPSENDSESDSDSDSDNDDSSDDEGDVMEIDLDEVEESPSKPPRQSRWDTGLVRVIESSRRRGLDFLDGEGE